MARSSSGEEAGPGSQLKPGLWGCLLLRYLPLLSFVKKLVLLAQL